MPKELPDEGERAKAGQGGGGGAGKKAIESFIINN